MASFTQFLCLSFFVITTLFPSLEITHARDSQFFSKVSRTRDDSTNPNNNYYKNRETENTPLSKQQERQQPTFVPQTTGAGYGLYGHETGLDAPSTTTSTTPSLYNIDDNTHENQNTKMYHHYNNVMYDNVDNNNNVNDNMYHNNNNMMFNNVDNSHNNNNNNNNNVNETMREQKNYTPELKGLSEFSYKSSVGPSKSVAENNYNNNGEATYVAENNNNGEPKYVAENNYNYNNNDNGETKYVAENNYNNDNGVSTFVAKSKYDNKNDKYYTGRTRYYNGGGVKKQGMSDTRHLENGKYFYDINAEKTSHPTNNYMFHNNNYGNNREINSHYDEYFNPNHYNNGYGNAMQHRVQNQFPEEDEFDFDGEQP